MLLYTQREETWPVTKMELEGRGVRKTPSSPSPSFYVDTSLAIFPLFVFWHAVFVSTEKGSQEGRLANVSSVTLCHGG